MSWMTMVGLLADPVLAAELAGDVGGGEGHDGAASLHLGWYYTNCNVRDEPVCATPSRCVGGAVIIGADIRMACRKTDPATWADIQRALPLGGDVAAERQRGTKCRARRTPLPGVFQENAVAAVCAGRAPKFVMDRVLAMGVWSRP
jgi:hypothetical protein